MTFKVKLSTFFILISFVVVSAMGFIFFPGVKERLLSGQTTLIQTAKAEEIYPLFFCPCCGEVLDPKKICCPMAQEMIDYINSLVKPGISKNDVVLAFAQKYGLNVFIDKEKQKEFKEQLVKSAPEDRPIISVTPEAKDLGDVSQKKGIMTTFFEIKNEGKKDLIINRMDSSCGCTSASVVFEGREGPRFAMAGHGIENSTDWQVVIPAGQTAQLKIYYDPNAHADLRGPVTREISIYSNDPIDFEKKATIELNQTP